MFLFKFVCESIGWVSMKLPQREKIKNKKNTNGGLTHTETVILTKLNVYNVSLAFIIVECMSTIEKPSGISEKSEVTVLYSCFYLIFEVQIKK